MLFINGLKGKLLRRSARPGETRRGIFHADQSRRRALAEGVAGEVLKDLITSLFDGKIVMGITLTYYETRAAALTSQRQKSCQ